MVQIGNFNPDGLTKLGIQKFNSVWGWYDSAKNREYAMLGSVDSIYFIDLSYNTPIVRDVVAGRAGKAIWRDFDNYGKYCYAAQDGIPGSLQVFDMSYLPDSVHTVYDSDSLLRNCHTIFRASDKLYCNTARRYNGNSAVLIMSLTNPEKPELAGVVIPPVENGTRVFNYCHDTHVRNDTMYCSGENSGLFIYDVSDPSDIKYINELRDYPEKGYNHSSWPTEDGKYIYMADENLGLGLKVVDVSDIHNLNVDKVFRSHAGAIPHNPYVRGNKLYVSYYEDGTYVFDISDPKNPTVMAFYDTYYQNAPGEYTGYNGCWSVYPYLPSGKILASDQTNGLFVLAMEATLSVEKTNSTSLMIYPNPAKDNLIVNLSKLETESYTITVLNTLGQTVYTKKIDYPTYNQTVEIPTIWNAGNYFLKIEGDNLHLCKKFVKQ